MIPTRPRNVRQPSSEPEARASTEERAKHRRLKGPRGPLSVPAALAQVPSPLCLRGAWAAGSQPAEPRQSSSPSSGL